MVDGEFEGRWAVQLILDTAANKAIIRAHTKLSSLWLTP